jgi:hypothetical protein
VAPPSDARPVTGDAWAEVVYPSDRTGLPIAAIVAFTPDPGVRQRWQAFEQVPAAAISHPDTPAPPTPRSGLRGEISIAAMREK